MMQRDAIGPVMRRLELLDSLRGFALAGVLFANLTAFSLYYFLPPSALHALPTLAADRWLAPFDHVFVSSKFITLFSLLFGVGFALQMQRNGDDRAGRMRYLRRLALLFLIGLLHAHLLWWGDVLRYYAVVGLFLVPTRRLPVRTLAIAGVLLVVVPHALVSAFWDTAGTLVATHDDTYAAALAAFASHDWTTMLRGNLAFVHWWTFAHWGEVTWVAGCLLIGSALGRLDALAEPARHRLLWKRLLRWALPCGLAASLLIEAADYGRLPMLADWPQTAVAWVASQIVRDAAALTLGVGLMAGFVALFALPSLHRWLRHLAPVGRMALSNYLTHSLLGVALFYGIGLGIGPRYGLVGVSGVFVLIFAAQIAGSRWWLARYRFGPAEWLWRSLTYGRRQPMRIVGIGSHVAPRPDRMSGA